MANYYTQMTVQPFVPADLLSDSDLEFLSYFGIYSEGKEELYLYAEEYRAEGDNGEGDTFEEDALIDFFQTKIKESGGRLKFISFEFAYTCSKMRPEAFGGAAYFITTEEFKHFGTQSWLMQQMEEVKK